MDRSAPANSYSYKPWVPSEIEMLTQLWPDPLLTTPQIAARMGRSYASVAMKGDKLKLGYRLNLSQQQAARRAAKS